MYQLLESPSDRRLPATATRAGRRLQIVGAAALYIALLHLAYVYLTAPYFAYYGLGYAPKSVEAVVWSWFAALLPAAWLPARSRRPSLIVYYILYAFVVVPACLVPSYTGLLTTGSLVEMQLMSLSCFALLGLTYLIPLSRIPRMRVRKTSFLVLLGVFSCATYLTIMHYVGFSFRFPNPLDPYDVRHDYNALTTTINSTWLAYSVNWQSFVVNPFFFIYGLLARKYYLVTLAIAGELAIYALAGLKSVLFAPLLILALLLVRRYRRFGFIFLLTLALFVGFCAACDILLGTSRGLTSLFVRRLMLMPGELTAMYYQFFSRNPFALLSQSVLKGFTNAPYAQAPPLLIGTTYFGHSISDVNANFWSDAFANFGYFGMIGATAICAGLLWFVDSLATNRNSRLILLMLGMPAYVIANSGLLTCLANHGVGLTVLLLYLLPREFDCLSQEPLGRSEVRHSRLASFAAG